MYREGIKCLFILLRCEQQEPMADNCGHEFFSYLAFPTVTTNTCFASVPQLLYYYCTISINSTLTCDCDTLDQFDTSTLWAVTCDKIKNFDTLLSMLWQQPKVIQRTPKHINTFFTLLQDYHLLTEVRCLVMNPSLVPHLLAQKGRGYYYWVAHWNLRKNLFRGCQCISSTTNHKLLTANNVLTNSIKHAVQLKHILAPSRPRGPERRARMFSLLAGRILVTVPFAHGHIMPGLAAI